MKKISRNWTPEEDKILIETMTSSQGNKLKWDEVASLMNVKNNKCQKTGKQCRQRWHNQLAPELNNSGKWTDEQNRVLFQQHNRLGNKWAKIALKLEGRTDNCVKNHFYSTLRRGMRKVNIFIHEARREKSSLKQFKPQVLTKILIVADGDPEQKLNFKNQANNLSLKIKQILIRISLKQDDNTDEEEIKQVMGFIMEFNKNCKKRKGKKKGPANKSQRNSSNEEECEDEVEKIQSEAKEEEIDVKNEQIEIKKQTLQVKKQEKSIVESTATKQSKSQVLKKSSLESIQSLDDRCFKLPNNTDFLDFMKNSGTEFRFGNFMNNNETFDHELWKKSSGMGIFGEGNIEIQPGEKGVINTQMLHSGEIGLFINDLEKSKMFDHFHHSPGLSNLFRDSNIAASPFTPQGTFNTSSFKNFRHQWVQQEQNEEKEE